MFAYSQKKLTHTNMRQHRHINTQTGQTHTDTHTHTHTRTAHIKPTKGWVTWQLVWLAHFSNINVMCQIFHHSTKRT